MKSMLTLHEWIVLAWFSVSIIAEVISSVGFVFWLRIHGVRVPSYLYGVPGYLEYRYWTWCKAGGRHSRRWITIRVLLMINIVAAFLFTYFVLLPG